MCKSPCWKWLDWLYALLRNFLQLLLVEICDLGLQTCSKKSAKLGLSSSTHSQQNPENSWAYSGCSELPKFSVFSSNCWPNVQPRNDAKFCAKTFLNWLEILCKIVCRNVDEIPAPKFSSNSPQSLRHSLTQKHPCTGPRVAKFSSLRSNNL